MNWHLFIISYLKAENADSFQVDKVRTRFVTLETAGIVSAVDLYESQRAASVRDSESMGSLVIDSEAAEILVLRGNEGHLTNMMEQVSLGQKYLLFFPFDK